MKSIEQFPKGEPGGQSGNESEVKDLAQRSRRISENEPLEISVTIRPERQSEFERLQTMSLWELHQLQEKMTEENNPDTELKLMTQDLILKKAREASQKKSESDKEKKLGELKKDILSNY